MHRLLARQLRRHLDSERLQEPALQSLFEAINLYYREADQERLLLENAMAVNSQELTQAVSRAQREHALLRGVMDSIPDLIFFKSTAGQYLGCNKAYERVLKVREADIVGRSDFEFMNPSLAQELADRDAQVLGTGRECLSERWYSGQEIGSGRDPGEQLCLEVLRTPYFSLDGKVAGLIGIGRDITERKLAEETILRQANFDALTGLANRRYFYERLQHEILVSQRNKLMLALMLIDLDKFKQVNDVMGHDAGDALLVEVAKRITSCVRVTDIVARLGGDEFVVVVPGLHHISNADRVAEKIVDQLAQPFVLGEETVSISGSVGVTMYPDNAATPEMLLKNADQAMYLAKSSGRNRYSHFTQALQEAAARRRQLTRDLPAAVESRQLIVCYQPIVCLQTGRVVKAEALVRWRHPLRGEVSPVEFIPLAEDTGAIVGIGDFVFHEAARFAMRLRTIGHADFQISVNKSPVQFRGARHIGAQWIKFLEELGLPGGALAIEITEGLLMKVEDITRARLTTLRDAGLQISLDDFGTGYSSMAYLKRLDLDSLKIDQSFVRDTATVADDRVLCEAMIAMAHKLGLNVVAEGIETPEQCQFLRHAGCDFGQGYLFSRPLPAEHFEVFLERIEGRLALDLLAPSGLPLP